MQNLDSVIFDMDGTLWDAVDTYVACWNRGFKEQNIQKQLTREGLSYMMGWEKRKALDHLLPEYDTEKQEQIYKAVDEAQNVLVPQMGGIIYNGVQEGLRRLAAKYKLFIVSNCRENLIQKFMKLADIEDYITDEMAHGVNSKPKHHNIKLLIEKHQLKNPVYVGDTETDSKESRLAGIPFIFLKGGFGTTEDYDLKFDNFIEMTDYLLALK
ncbi:MAG: hypothetical protein JWN56_2102 [Sphingobacteriales bacterium]|nr:hypothetical protein [Sphingobacteriales bacterium]